MFAILPVIFMETNEPELTRVDKKNYWIFVAIFASVILMGLGTYFARSVSTDIELRAVLSGGVHKLASFFVTTGDGSKEIISLEDDGTPRVVRKSQPEDNNEASSSLTNKLSVVPAPNKNKTTQGNAKSLSSAAAMAKPTISPRILISEIMASTQSSSTNEFIELYNPADQEFDLSGLYIKRKATAAGVVNNLVSKTSSIFNGKNITPHGFFLVGSKAYGGSVALDVLYSQSSTFLADNGDVIMLYDASDNIIDEVAYGVLVRGKSWERRALVGGTCVSPQGANELLGNGCDMGSSTDFVLRDVPNPQNGKSAPEK